MSAFNSLGSNYNFSFAVEALLMRDSGKFNAGLKKFLEKKYNGKVALFYKGREAIKAALELLNLPKGTFVAINGFTCYAVYKAIIDAGYMVEYLDLDKLDLNFSPNKLRKKLRSNSKIKIIIIQNTLGYPCDIEEIKNICDENKIFLIEDLAHSTGAIYSNIGEVGSVGDFTILSFSQDKIIDGISGGALVVRNKRYLNRNVSNFNQLKTEIQLKDRFYPLLTYIIRNTYKIILGKLLHRMLKQMNLLSKPMDDYIGEGYHKLPDWYCSLVMNKFNHLPEELQHRKDIAAIYKNHLNKKVLSGKIVKAIDFSTNLRFPIFVENRRSLINFLRKHDIFISDIWYDAPIAPRKLMQDTNYENQCPGSEIISSRIVNLPTHISVSRDTALRLSSLINIWIKPQQKA